MFKFEDIIQNKYINIDEKGNNYEPIDNSAATDTFNIYETVILYDAYMDIISGEDADKIAQQVSKELRQMAVNSGIEIDDEFRNIHCIKKQLFNLEQIELGAESKNRTATKNLLKIIDIYKNDMPQYEKILEDAKKICEKVKTSTTKMNKAESRFDIFEAIILLDGCIKITNGANSKDIISGISKALKQKAINNGNKIDESYRSLGGIRWQASLMDSAMRGEKFYNKKIPNIFNDAINIYNSDKTTFYIMLNRALDMCKSNNQLIEDAIDFDINREGLSIDYYDWMVNNGVSESCARGYKCALLELDEYAKNRKIWGQSIYEVKDSNKYEEMVRKIYQSEGFYDYNKRKHHKFSATLAKFSSFRFNVTLFEKSKEEKDQLEQHNIESIKKILIKYFRYGFRLGSQMEYMRLQNYASCEGLTIPEDVEQLKQIIMKSGFCFEEKIYVYDQNSIAELKDIVDLIFDSGVNTIFYESLFLLNEEWLTQHSIYSKEILKEIMKNNFGEYYYGGSFMSKKFNQMTNDAIIDEVDRIWGDKYLLNCEDITKDLIYIPYENLRRAISGSDKYVWYSANTYLKVDNISITNSEKDEILQFANMMCNQKGYLSILEIPIDTIANRYYFLESNALAEVVFNQVLISSFKRNGKILYRGDTQSVVEIVKKEYYDKDECHFNDVEHDILKVSGTNNRQYAFKVVYDTMVRKDKDTYISNKYVKFHSELIDPLILKTMGDRDFIALREIVNFALFPICGIPWNIYVLESYLYRYSYELKLELIGFNDKNVGFIVKKGVQYTYKEMLAIIAANSGLQLESNLMGKYFYDNGYLAKSKYGAMDEIMKMAMKIRED